MWPVLKCSWLVIKKLAHVMFGNLAVDEMFGLMGAVLVSGTWKLFADAIALIMLYVQFSGLMISDSYPLTYAFDMGTKKLFSKKISPSIVYIYFCNYSSY